MYSETIVLLTLLSDKQSLADLFGILKANYVQKVHDLYFSKAFNICCFFKVSKTLRNDQLRESYFASFCFPKVSGAVTVIKFFV
jgi:hypothetical protein